jgi:SNF2 family DNA or RNA helicase
MLDPIELLVENETVLVTGGPELETNRSVRLFFSAILGAERIEGGWRCPRRQATVQQLIIRINSFLEAKGFPVRPVGVADDAVQREIERRRSYQRARSAATQLRDGESIIDLKIVLRKLSTFGWNETARKLFPHQEIGLIHGITAVNAANFSVPGAGKTITTLAIAAIHMSNGDIDCAIVVGPLSCFAPWEKESKAALPNRIDVRRVRGPLSERRDIYSGIHRHDLILMSYATAATDRAELIELCRRMKVMLIVDESHRVKKFRGGLWAPALMDIAKHARVKMTLSGTPMPQNGRDLYSQLRILWPSGELTGPADDFASRVDKNFISVLSDVRPFISRTPKHDLGLDPYIVQRHSVELTGTQAEIYTLIEDQFRRSIQDVAAWRDKIDALKRAKPIRLLQAAANPDLLNKVDGYYHLPRFVVPNPTLLQRLADYRHHEMPAKSLKALEILSGLFNRKETGQKAVCWSNFIQNLDQFAELVRSRLQIPVFQIDGRVATGDQNSDDNPGGRSVLDYDTREAIIERFLGTDGPAVLITNPASTSESISLHSTCHNAVYLDRTYDCALFLQSIDRIHRLGLRRGQAVEVHIVTAALLGNRPTIDELVDRSLLAKEATMRLLLEGAELRPLETPDDPLRVAEGDDRDLETLLRFLLGENVDGTSL